MVDSRPSRAKRLTLRNNGIQQRYYAIDPSTGRATHTNAQMTALAVRDALARADWRMADLDVLACGTSSPDQLKPAHASMTHGELGGAPLEAITTAGVCGAGVTAMKYAALAIKAGDARRAVCTGSEIASGFMVARNFSPESADEVNAAEQRPALAFEKDFLRWMLSDGAGAALLASEPIPGRRALRIDWIDGVSLAHELPVCMYSGAIRDPDGRLRGWREAPSPLDAAREHYFAVKQDARLLNDLIPRMISKDTVGAIMKRRGVTADEVTWFLPHYSSNYLIAALDDSLRAAGISIPRERWYNNMVSIGNIGSASMYLMLEALFHGNRLRGGDRVLCLVPESARIACYLVMLTVV